MATFLDLWSLLLGVGAEPQASSDGPPQLSQRQTYVVVLDGTTSPKALPAVVADLLGRVSPKLQPRQLYDQLSAFSVDLDDGQAQRLRSLDGIRSVEADRPIPAMPPVTVQPKEIELQSTAAELQQLTTYGNSTSASGETLPWGVRAVWNGTDVGAKGNIGSGTKVFVIDSGVLATTGDLNLNTSWSRSWIPGESAFSDGVGHGTHVAGTIAALANGSGVVGVAPGAEVVSLKVFSDSGGGASITSIVDAVNYAVGLINNNGLDRSKVVINMSLGGGLSSSLTNAILNAANQGIRFTIAAGNSGQDADGFAPANAGYHPNVYTISAVDSAYKMASWSNWDRINASDPVDNVDLAAPGVGVLSYYKGGQLANLSGTSMAAPHVAGLLLTGGVTAGSLATPSVAGTADPFALASSTVTPPPTPTYSLEAAASVNEAGTLSITVVTTNVAAGTMLRLQLSGDGISVADLASGSLTAVITVDANGRGNFTTTVLADQRTEGREILQINLFNANATGTSLAQAAVSIADTSIDPPANNDGNLVLWGTTQSDQIIGGSGNDRLSGVLASGTKAAAMGSRQVDVLTGGAGSDVFVLGDIRGIFYNNRDPGTTGKTDYAQITDFRSGLDKIQLFKSSYVATVSNGSTLLYWDSNNNGIVNTGGKRPDELIAVFTNATLANSDVIWA
ncbi:MAG: hypothetical protein RLZZ336_1250 [Cyanobacteriota bacterium]